MDNQEIISLQLHYYLDDKNLHSINAKVHNDCEKQFIQAINLLNKYLDKPIELEVLAKKEGGVLDVFLAIINDPVCLILITSAVNQFFISNFRPAISVTDETKNKLDNVLKIKEVINAGVLTDDEFDYIVENDKDLRKLKSNFFKSAKKEKRITSIEIEAINQNKVQLFEKITINSTDFDSCILTEDEESKTTEVDAQIYIVAPVLLRGRRDFWKGIYNDEPIEFKVTDKVFLENVYQHIIKFSNGTFINCSMKITRTTSSIDDIEKISRNVFEVDSWGDNENFRTITKRNNRYSQKDSKEKLPNLFSENE